MQVDKSWLQSLIVNFVNTNPENMLEGEKFWAAPLVGFTAGNDQIFREYQKPEICGPLHWTPLEAFRQAFPSEQLEAKQLGVVSWILPQTENTKSEMRRQTKQVGKLWARSRIFGEEFHEKLRKYVVDKLAAKGIKACAPTQLPGWTKADSPERVITSSWSERHVAHACGLGTFGLCDGLITPVGKAHRTGSVIFAAEVEPAARPYQKHTEYCLYFTKGTCRACLYRCPAGALSEQGHNKLLCYEYVYGFNAEYSKQHYGFNGVGCGLCQTKVPCESKIP